MYGDQRPLIYRERQVNKVRLTGGLRDTSILLVAEECVTEAVLAVDLPAAREGLPTLEVALT